MFQRKSNRFGEGIKSSKATLPKTLWGERQTPLKKRTNLSTNPLCLRCKKRQDCSNVMAALHRAAKARVLKRGREQALRQPFQLFHRELGRVCHQTPIARSTCVPEKALFDPILARSAPK